MAETVAAVLGQTQPLPDMTLNTTRTEIRLQYRSFTSEHLEEAKRVLETVQSLETRQNS